MIELVELLRHRYDPEKIASIVTETPLSKPYDVIVFNEKGDVLQSKRLPEESNIFLYIHFHEYKSVRSAMSSATGTTPRIIKININFQEAEVSILCHIYADSLAGNTWEAKVWPVEKDAVII